MPPSSKPVRITYVRKFGTLLRAQINASKDKSRIEYHFLFRGNGRRESVEFSTSPEVAVALMLHLQKLQALYKIPIPANLRPGGRPNLRVVEPDEP
jgi:hypothetical protein